MSPDLLTNRPIKRQGTGQPYNILKQDSSPPLPRLLTPGEIVKHNRDKIVKRALDLKAEFYQALDTAPDKQPQGSLSYEPWLERAKYERIMAACASPEEQLSQRSAFIQESEVQLETALRERYSTEKSTIPYEIKDNSLRSKYFPDEDFEEVLQRGIDYRKQNGSNDLDREEQELVGFIKVKEMLTHPNTAIGTKVISFSPPSLVEGTPYTKNFVDIWELKVREDGQKYAEFTRFNSNLDNDGYQKAALKFNPTFLTDLESLSSEPLDAYFLSRPILVSYGTNFKDATALYEAHFQKNFKAMVETKFQPILSSARPFIDYFNSQLIRSTINWKDIATSFNAILNVGAEVLKNPGSIYLYRETTRFKKDSIYDIDIAALQSKSQPLSSIEDQIAYWGNRVVRAIGAGCGTSTGFGVGSENPYSSSSVASFAGGTGAGKLSETDRYGSLEFKCPKCNMTNKRSHNQLQSSCHHCKADVTC